MARLLLSNQFREKIIIADGGVGIYLRGFVLIEDTRFYFDSLSDDDLRELTINHLRLNTNIIDDPTKPYDTDILNKSWPLTYVPAIEYDGKSKIGTYELHYDASIQYELGQSIKNKTITAIALIGQSVQEQALYIKPKNKSYLAGFIMLDGDEKTITDNDSYLFNIDVALTPDAELSLTLNDSIDYESTYAYGNGQDSTTNQLAGSYLMAPTIDKRYSKMPSTVKNLKNFINLLSPTNTLNNVMSTRRPVTIWSTSEEQRPQLQLSIGGLNDSNKFVSSEIAFSFKEGDIKICPTTDLGDTRFDIHPGQFCQNDNFAIKNDITSAFSGVGFSLFSNSNTATTATDTVNINTTAVNFYNDSDAFTLDSRNSKLGKSKGNDLQTTLIKAVNIKSGWDGVESMDVGNTYMAASNVCLQGFNKPTSDTTFIGVNGVSAFDISAKPVYANDPSIDEGGSLVIGENNHSLLYNHHHNVLIGFKGLYGHGTDRYIFGRHNVNFSCPACSGTAWINRPITPEGSTQPVDHWIPCDICNGVGKRMPLFAFGNGDYRGNYGGLNLLNYFAGKNGADSIDMSIGYRENLFAVEPSACIENVHYRLSEGISGKTPFDYRNLRADTFYLSKHRNEPVNGTGYSLKPCYYTKGYIAFPRAEHNEVYRIDYYELHNLIGGVYDNINNSTSNELVKGRSRLDGTRNYWFKGIKNFVITINPTKRKSVFGISDITAAVFNTYKKNLHNPNHFIDTSYPVNIFTRNIGSQDAFIKGQAWYKGASGIHHYQQRKGLKSGETLRIVYRKGFGHDLEGILNFRYNDGNGWLTNIGVVR